MNDCGVTMKKLPTLFSDPHDCCGCTACQASCPVNAIRMVPDNEGFLYPRIDQDKCIGCGTCERVCQLKSPRDQGEPLAIFAVKNKDLDCRMKSSSGGMFSLLAEFVEKQGGVIYGAAFDNGLKVCHMRATSRNEWERFCAAKYVQSDLNDCYSQVRKDLEFGKTVLFSGTPCQVEGLIRFLGNKHTDKLITCDIVCHGVPSPAIWQDWLSIVERKKGQDAHAVNFRDKTPSGWHKSSLSLFGKDGIAFFSGTHADNTFSRLFFSHLIVRPSCHKCPYASYHRPGDLTLGDYWGIEKHLPEFDDDKGVSLVMCNSKRGRAVFESVCGQTEFVQITKEQSIQPNLVKPSDESNNRLLFWNLFHRIGLEKTIKVFKFGEISIWESLLVKIFRSLLRAAGKLS